jgi:hypothetical protein
MVPFLETVVCVGALVKVFLDRRLETVLEFPRVVHQPGAFTTT